MPATADDLRGLHELHRRAKALRDRLESGPKTLAARQRGLEKRQQALEEARNALKQQEAEPSSAGDAGPEPAEPRRRPPVEAQRRQEERRVQGDHQRDRHDQQGDRQAGGRDPRADAGGRDRPPPSSPRRRPEAKKFAAEVEALAEEIESKAEGQRAQLAELEAAIVESEALVPDEDRERYRRNVKQRGEDAFAAVDSARQPRLRRLQPGRHHPGRQRADDRRPPRLLQDLRPDPLPRRGLSRPPRRAARSSAALRAGPRPPAVAAGGSAGLAVLPVGRQDEEGDAEDRVDHQQHRPLEPVRLAVLGDHPRDEDRRARRRRPPGS